MNYNNIVNKKIMLSLENIDVLYKLTATEYKILFELLKSCKLDDENIIIINKYKREMLSKNVNASESTIKNACTKFIKTNILTRIATGVYNINLDIIQVVKVRKMEDIDYEDYQDEEDLDE